jgi:hypothetical protein
MDRSNFRRRFNFLVEKLQGSIKFALNDFETAVNVLRFLSDDPKITRSESFKKQMLALNDIIEARPSDKKLFADGWTEDEISSVKLSAEDFKEIMVKIGIDREESSIVSWKKIWVMLGILLFLGLMFHIMVKDVGPGLVTQCFGFVNAHIAFF